MGTRALGFRIQQLGQLGFGRGPRTTYRSGDLDRT